MEKNDFRKIIDSFEDMKQTEEIFPFSTNYWFLFALKDRKMGKVFRKNVLRTTETLNTLSEDFYSAMYMQSSETARNECHRHT